MGVSPARAEMSANVEGYPPPAMVTFHAAALVPPGSVEGVKGVEGISELRLLTHQRHMGKWPSTIHGVPPRVRSLLGGAPACGV